MFNNAIERRPIWAGAVRVGCALFMMGCFVSISIAKAATVEDLQVLLQTLIAQVAALQHTSADSGGTYSTSTNLLHIGVSVTTTDVIRVRSAAGINAPFIAFNQAGAQGIVVDGPVVKDGYNWFKVDYATGTDGWNSGSWLRERTDLPDLKGIYVSYKDDVSFEVVQSITRLEALAHCKTTTVTYSESSVRCTWRGGNLIIATTTKPTLPIGVSGGEPIVKIVTTGSAQLAIPTSAYSCNTNGHNKPDMPVHGFRDAANNIHILATNSQDLQFVVRSWDFVPTDLKQLCTTMLAPQYDGDAEKTKIPTPQTLSQKRWLTSSYTLDGKTVYAYVHNEFHGEDYTSLRSQGCNSGGEKCWWASISSYISKDSGMTFIPVSTPPTNYIAGPWYPFTAKLPNGTQSGRAGTAGHTNVVKGPDNFYYLYTNILAEQGAQESGDMCLLRSSNLLDWYYWDGTGFAKKFTNPYMPNGLEATAACATIHAGFRTRAFVYSPTFKVFVAVYGNSDGYYYATSPDLLHWSKGSLFFPGTATDAVASFIDPKSTSRSFDTIGNTPYLFFSRDVSKKTGEVWRVPLTITTR